MTLDFTLTIPPHPRPGPSSQTGQQSKMPGRLEDPLYVRVWHSYVRFCSYEKKDPFPKKLICSLVGFPLHLSQTILSLMIRLGLMKRSEQVDLIAGVSYRTKIMQETLTRLKEGSYTSPDGIRHNLNLEPAARGVKVVLSGGQVRQRPGSERTKISVKNQDCLYAASDLHAKGLNPIVLDMASNGHFGGGYLSGARAQEEECCRRSGLCLPLDTQHGLQQSNFYPLHKHSPYAGLYVPHIPIIRDASDQQYRFMNHPFDVAFGVIAAINQPPVKTVGGKLRLTPEATATTREKIRTFLQMAYEMGHRSVVFGALGCGAFRNPPDHVAEIAFDVITKEFAHCFKEIVISISKTITLNSLTISKGILSHSQDG
jgi:uncharacterized protein (TIGR02452 family)